MEFGKKTAPFDSPFTRKRMLAGAFRLIPSEAIQTVPELTARRRDAPCLSRNDYPGN